MDPGIATRNLWPGGLLPDSGAAATVQPDESALTARRRAGGLGPRVCPGFPFGDATPFKSEVEAARSSPVLGIQLSAGQRAVRRPRPVPALQSSAMSGAGAVIGASDHYGRTELVTLAVEDGVAVFLDRRRVALIGEGLPIAPYHHEAPALDMGAATALVNQVRRSVAEHARSAILMVLEAYVARVLILPASPHQGLPDSLDEVLNSPPLTLAAAGMLYRESLADAAAEFGLEVRRYSRKIDQKTRAARAMGVEAAQVSSLLDQFGRVAGPPWRKDHKMAASAALSVLGSQIRFLTPPPQDGAPV